MITKQEILAYASEVKLLANAIEKDYVLSWLLAGIAAHPALAEFWVFKGGTCLKKCFFGEYRFSEDLDYTLLKKEHVNTGFLQEKFYEIADWIYEQSGIEIPKTHIAFEQYTNANQVIFVQGKVGYLGPLQRQGSISRIKLDLTHDEIQVLEPELRQVYHSYSYALKNQLKVYCYCLEEIFAEKIRALAERLRPRDLYDVINLYKRNDFKVNKPILLDCLKEKCNFRNISLPNLNMLSDIVGSKNFSTEWQQMLAHQINELEPFEFYWEQLSEFFDWLYEG